MAKRAKAPNDEPDFGDDVQSRTKRIRIRVCIDELGNWVAFGAGSEDDDEADADGCDITIDEQLENAPFGQHRLSIWVTADVELAKAGEVQGSIEP